MEEISGGQSSGKKQSSASKPLSISIPQLHRESTTGLLLTPHGIRETNSVHSPDPVLSQPGKHRDIDRRSMVRLDYQKTEEKNSKEGSSVQAPNPPSVPPTENIALSRIARISQLKKEAREKLSNTDAMISSTSSDSKRGDETYSQSRPSQLDTDSSKPSPPGKGGPAVEKARSTAHLPVAPSPLYSARSPSPSQGVNGPWSSNFPISPQVTSLATVTTKASPPSQTAVEYMKEESPRSVSDGQAVDSVPKKNDSNAFSRSNMISPPVALTKRVSSMSPAQLQREAVENIEARKKVFARNESTRGLSLSSVKVPVNSGEDGNSSIPATYGVVYNLLKSSTTAMPEGNVEIDHLAANNDIGKRSVSQASAVTSSDGMIDGTSSTTDPLVGFDGQGSDTLIREIDHQSNSKTDEGHGDDESHFTTPLAFRSASSEVNISSKPGVNIAARLAPIAGLPVPLGRRITLRTLPNELFKTKNSESVPFGIVPGSESDSTDPSDESDDYSDSPTFAGDEFHREKDLFRVVRLSLCSRITLLLVLIFAFLLAIGSSGWLLMVFFQRRLYGTWTLDNIVATKSVRIAAGLEVQSGGVDTDFLLLRPSTFAESFINMSSPASMQSRSGDGQNRYIWTHSASSDNLFLLHTRLSSTQLPASNVQSAHPILEASQSDGLVIHDKASFLASNIFFGGRYNASSAFRLSVSPSQTLLTTKGNMSDIRLSPGSRRVVIDGELCISSNGRNISCLRATNGSMFGGSQSIFNIVNNNINNVINNCSCPEPQVQPVDPFIGFWDSPNLVTSSSTSLLFSNPNGEFIRIRPGQSQLRVDASSVRFDAVNDSHVEFRTTKQNSDFVFKPSSRLVRIENDLNVTNSITSLNVTSNEMYSSKLSTRFLLTSFLNSQLDDLQIFTRAVNLHSPKLTFFSSIGGNISTSSGSLIFSPANRIVVVENSLTVSSSISCQSLSSTSLSALSINSNQVTATSIETNSITSTGDLHLRAASSTHSTEIRSATLILQNNGADRFNFSVRTGNLLFHVPGESTTISSNQLILGNSPSRLTFNGNSYSLTSTEDFSLQISSGNIRFHGGNDRFILGTIASSALELNVPSRQIRSYGPSVSGIGLQLSSVHGDVHVDPGSQILRIGSTVTMSGALSGGVFNLTSSLSSLSMSSTGINVQNSNFTFRASPYPSREFHFHSPIGSMTQNQIEFRRVYSVNTIGGHAQRTWAMRLSNGRYIFSDYLRGTRRDFLIMDPEGGTLGIAGVATTISSIKVKTNVQNIDSSSALSQVLQLRGVTYNYRQPSSPSIHSSDSSTVANRRSAGFIAEEVSNILPNVVVHTQSESSGSSPSAIAYQEIIPYVVESLKELHQRLADAERRILELMKSCPSPPSD